jgi:DNA repair exonuclease SbcCD nuclease subunit
MNEVIFLLTDTHFGKKQNSIIWLNSQISFLEEQFIPSVIKCAKNNKVKIIHMGDVFDSRSTISTMVATKIIDVFKTICDIPNTELHIIAGNHDFYSPNSDEIDTLTLLLGNLNLHLHVKDIYLDNDRLYVPWYKWGSDDVQFFIDNKCVNYIFTHADIVKEKIPYKNIKNVKVFSGHLHIPYIKNNIYNIGSSYALDFADSNHDRGYYVIEGDKVKFIPNEYSIRFWRLYNEDLFDDDKLNKINKQDYIELYISQDKMNKEEYISSINNITNNFKNTWIIPKSDNDLSGELEKFEEYDIEEIIDNLIPVELKEKYRLIKQTAQS